MIETDFRNDEALVMAPTEDGTAGDFATFGAVHLDVTDGERALRFWRDPVGLEPLADAGDGIRLGAGDRELVVLHPGASAPTPRKYSGLYHLALHLPSLAEFARVVARLDAFVGRSLIHSEERTMIETLFVPMITLDQVCRRARNHYLDKHGIRDPDRWHEVRFSIPFRDLKLGLVEWVHYRVPWQMAIDRVRLPGTLR